MSAIVRSKGVMPSLQCERSAILLLCGLILALAKGLYAQSVAKQGEEYSVSGSRAGDQSCPQISVGPAGGYVVWQDNAIDGPGKSFGIAARKLSADLLPLPGVFRVNQNPNGPQENPQVALLKNGGAAFVWQGGKLGGQDIYFRVRSPAGVMIPKGDLRVNTFLTGQQSRPVITRLANGNLAVAWCSLHQDRSLEGVYARIVTPAGLFGSAPFRVNQFTANNQKNPAITTLSNGTFVVVWVSESQGVSTFEAFHRTNRVHVYARVFRNSGVAASGEFRINTRSNLCANPSVAPWGAAGFTVTWAEQSDERSNNWDIYARSFSAAAEPAGEAVLVNEITYGDQFTPKIAQLGSNHLVVWNSLGHDGSREGVFGRFLAEGAAAGSEFLVNTHTNSSQIHPTVTANGTDRFLAAWCSYMGLSSCDIQGQQYNAEEVPASGLEMTIARPAPPQIVTVPPPPPTPLTPVTESGGVSTNRILRVSLANTVKGKVLSWNTEAGGTYQVQYSTNFSRWENLGEPRPATAASDATIVGDGGDATFYRVIRVQ
jgi:hypothetical protein